MIVILSSLSLYWMLPVILEKGIGAQETLKVLEETAHPTESDHSEWRLASGGLAIVEGKNANTLYGSLEPENKWRKIYLRRNPMDTDNGYHPQNIFRLLSKVRWREPSQSISFTIIRDQLSTSPNRNESSGIFLLSKYQNESNYYYAGITVDGRAVIRKKQSGIFVTLAEEKILEEEDEYDRWENPSLLPKATPITMQTETFEENESLIIKLYVNSDLVLEARDNQPILSAPGLVGIRSDFMDVRFNNYETKEVGVM